MILVTGCAGFIGSHLVERLLIRGYNVIGIDNFDSYYPVSIKKMNVKQLRGNKNFEFLKADIGNPSIRKQLKDIETIYHLAARGGVRKSLKDPIVYHKINVDATLNLLNVCSDVENFVFASSSSVYGDLPPDKLPVKEIETPQPVSPYAATKLAAEAYCLTFGRSYGFPVAILRYFTVYGPRQRPDEVVYKFVRSLFEGVEPEIYGDGEQTRDFVFVTDVVNGTILAGEKRVKGIYNIGSGRRRSINELIRLLLKFCKVNIKPKYVEKKPGDVRHTWANINKAKKDFGYKPSIGLEEGVKKFVEWFKRSYQCGFCC
jgi:nucleoside-diphosphate-sugar epimerase